jgi:asparagine synthetase B (glutamine-hydrolysing)
MCGILAILSLGIELSALRALVKRDVRQDSLPYSTPPDFLNMNVESIMQALSRRGPDSQKWCERTIQEGQGMLAIYSAVLHLRGDQRCDQPVVDTEGNILAWNGEIFGGKVVVPVGFSDTAILSSHLLKAISLSESNFYHNLLQNTVVD